MPRTDAAIPYGCVAATTQSSKPSSWSGVWAAVKVIRRRAVPSGTVGGRIAGTQYPRSFNRAASNIACSFLPMIIGCIGVRDDIS